MPQAAGMPLIDNGNVFASLRPRRERNKFRFLDVRWRSRDSGHTQKLMLPPGFTISKGQ